MDTNNAYTTARLAGMSQEQAEHLVAPKPPLGRVRILAQSEAADKATQMRLLRTLQETTEQTRISVGMGYHVTTDAQERMLFDAVRALAALGFGPDNMRIAYEQMARASEA